ncbi:hypothetical protein [Sphingomonas sp.]|uniref:hypothetical protein n=1 Tax=Sphingomonas sp. TaxID=28214 RepID=UPI0026246206|nr:hypothetical protein [Sphingomonas sp.]
MTTMLAARRIAKGSAVTLAFALAAEGRAQVAPLDGHTFNPPARTITLSVASELLYDTNVARGSEEVATLRGLDRKDVRSSTVAAIDLSLPGGRGSFDLLGQVGYDAYARNSRLDRERIDLSAAGKLSVAFCGVNAGLGYRRGQSDLADLSLVANLPDGAAVNVQTVSRADLSLTCGPQIGVRPFASIGHVDTANSAAVRQVQDVTQTHYAAGLAYVNPAVGIVSVVVRRTTFDYDRRSVDSSLGPPRFRVSYAGVGFDRRLGAALQMTASIGYAAVSEPAMPSARRLNGLNWDLATSLRLADTARLTLRTSRTIDAAPGTFANQIRRSSYGGTIVYALGPALRFDATASLMTRNFEFGAAPRPLQLIDDTTQDYALGMEYRRERARVRLTAAYRRRDATPDLYDFSGFLLSLGVRYELER